MTDKSTTNNVNNVYDNELFCVFSTYFARQTAFFLHKTKLYNGKINKSYDIMYSKRFVLKETYYIIDIG